MIKRKIKIKTNDLRLKLVDMLKLFDSKMFTTKLLRLEQTHESFPTVWGLIKSLGKKKTGISSF